MLAALDEQAWARGKVANKGRASLAWKLPEFKYSTPEKGGEATLAHLQGSLLLKLEVGSHQPGHWDKIK